jgi:hypothetical protein
VLTYLTATLMMALTAFSDPGTVPAATAATRRAPPSPSEVLINGATVRLKYCVACGIQVPRRAHRLVGHRCLGASRAASRASGWG